MLALGKWYTAINIMDIPYNSTLSILGIEVATSVNLSCDLSWEKVTNIIRAKAQQDYARRLTFDARVRFIHEQFYVHVC
jgi:hypothetical protein